MSCASHPSESAPGSSKGSSQSGLELKLEQVEKEVWSTQTNQQALHRCIPAITKQIDKKKKKRRRRYFALSVNGGIGDWSIKISTV